MKDIIHWTILSSKEVFKTNFFRLREDRCELPDKKVMPNYYVMEWTPWCNVVALTENQEIILIEQYRHAAGKNSIEIPGGAVDNGESPLLAAKRELLEETGYSSDDFTLLGSHYPNPALQNNEMHTFLARNCKVFAAPHFDEFENIRTFKVPIRDAFTMVTSGQITHSLMIASLYLARGKLGL